MGVIIKKSFNTTIVNYIGVIIAFISILFIQTKVLTESEIGTIRLILDKAIIVMPFFMFGLPNIITRFYFHFEKDQKNYGSFISTILLTPAVSVLVGYLMFFSFVDIPYFNLIVIVLISNIYIGILESYLTTKSNILVPAIIRNIIQKLLFILIVVLYYYEWIDFTQVLYGYTSIQVVHVLLLLFPFKKNLIFRVKINASILKMPVFKEVLVYSSFLILGAGSGILVSKLDTIMIEGITKNDALVGIYTIAFSMATIIEIPRRPIINLTVPFISLKLSENKLNEVDSLYKKSSINLLIIGSVIFSLLWLNIDFIFSVIPNGDTYAQGKSIVLFLGLAKLFDLAVGLNSEIIQNSKYYKWNILLMPFLAAISIASNYYFISKYGYLGAAFATFLSILLYNSLRTFIVYWKLGLNPFYLNYFKVLPFLLLPFILDYFFRTEYYILNAVLNAIYLLFFFILPIYVLKLSDEINSIIDTIIKRATKLIKRN